MSNHYAGPFGQPGDTPYQLPPPRAPANFTDQYARPRQTGDMTDAGSISAPVVPPTANPPRNEQLPSVRDLLTPTVAPTSPNAYQPPFAAPPSNSEPRELSYPFRPHEQALSPVAAQERIKTRSESFSQQQTSTLPPLSQVGMHNQPHAKHHIASRSDPVSTYAHSQPGYSGAPYYERALSGEGSSPEVAGGTKANTALPQVVDERYVDGEGLCYVYADGTHVPKLIDGVPVNAHWGITKAGKPRKRLAQACLTCREKKIKCQPNLPKCDQCQKSGRECRFESAPRGSRFSMRASSGAGPSPKYDSRDAFPPAPITASETSPPMYHVLRASTSTNSLPGNSGQSPTSEGRRLTSSPIERSYETTERMYTAHAVRDPRRFAAANDNLTTPVDPPAHRLAEYLGILEDLNETGPEAPLASSWAIDPFQEDPEATIYFVESYFSSVNDGMYHIFPRARFIWWLRSCRTKSAEDRMLLYSMMALGALFSDRPNRMMTLRKCSRIARFASQKNQHAFCLQLAQTHLILSLLYYGTGSLVACWDSLGAAGRVVSALRYNLESGGVTTNQNQVCDYGLHPHALVECRRRTFWVTYILDRFSSFFSASSTFISPESALLRLPCREDIYEAQQNATAPYFQSVFNQASAPADNDRAALSPMAFLIQIISIWGDVSLNVFRLAHTPSDGYARSAEEFHMMITRRTDDWFKGLPDHLLFSAFNLERASLANKADAFVSIHMFHHATLMKLYRHARYSSLRPDVLIQYVHRARYHAVETLRIAMAVMQYTNEGPRTALLSPFLGYVILSAVDVLSTAGLVNELPDCISLIRSAFGVIQLMSRYWGSSLDLANAVQKRLASMIDCLNDRARIQDKVGFAVDGPSLEMKVRTNASPSYSGPVDEDMFNGSMHKGMLVRAMRAEDVMVPESSIVILRDH
ncbi:hypothetical protein N7468_008224 [Penicillium chermesinum]|uniref:Zn(2)-C6 fungal-type domain-containing protein n=1 Tax=Penicillium chermesinum TaxID=63820 RepID=A0A9W9TI35_9EURO|nr:uncharacterized protein N7468_008224 [Penicillium chermesinum]KAJ5223682.1 hypothetical protein N7468_008224 [Penicillium chermesinum]